jgi:GWxTD domain-containing protein
MNSKILIGIFCLFLTSLHGQVLRDLDYSHQYNPVEPFIFTYDVIKTDDGYRVFYDFSRVDTTQYFEAATIQFETRQSLGEKSGLAVSGVLTQLRGSLNFTADPGHKILVAVVTTGTANPRKMIFHKRLPTKKSLFVTAGNSGLTRSYTNTNRSISIEGSSGRRLQVSYYGTSFPPGSPAFSTALTKVPKTMDPDSVFTVAESAPVSPTKKGLYLVQADTASADGVAFRVENDYPKFATIESLAGPMLYVCTKTETEKIKQAQNDKKKFDQIILSITGNSERARTFMRGYFKRVEYANIYFTSYKEGWKTDRGMIYIVFGPPDEVYLFDDREIWDYKSNDTKVRFQFVKSPTLFDPDNYVLIRDKKYETIWYKTVDLWRKTRF